MTIAALKIWVGILLTWTALALHQRAIAWVTLLATGVYCIGYAIACWYTRP